MEKTIHDQLIDSNAVNVLRHSIFESALLGTGIIKGPFNFNKTIHNWSMDDGEKVYEPYEKTVPRIEAVSCWNFYPDPAATSISDAEYVIQRHRYNREQVRELASRPFFIPEAIDAALKEKPYYDEK